MEAFCTVAHAQCCNMQLTIVLWRQVTLCSWAEPNFVSWVIAWWEHKVERCCQGGCCKPPPGHEISMLWFLRARVPGFAIHSRWSRMVCLAEVVVLIGTITCLDYNIWLAIKILPIIPFLHSFFFLEGIATYLRGRSFVCARRWTAGWLTSWIKCV